MAVDGDTKRPEAATELQRQQSLKLETNQQKIASFFEKHYATYVRYYNNEVMGASWLLRFRAFFASFLAPKSALVQAVQAKYSLRDQVKAELSDLMLSKQEQTPTKETLKEAVHRVWAWNNDIQKRYIWDGVRSVYELKAHYLHVPKPETSPQKPGNEVFLTRLTCQEDITSREEELQALAEENFKKTFGREGAGQTHT